MNFVTHHSGDVILDLFKTIHYMRDTYYIIYCHSKNQLIIGNTMVTADLRLRIGCRAYHEY